jgi:hypothetical protein
LSIPPGHKLRIACAKTPHIVGKWKEIGKTATLEFRKDGTFKAVDNQGMAVSGKYTLIKPGNVRFEIFRQGSPSEIVNGTFSLQGDVLIVTSADGKEVERYKREKK